ncbi:integrase [Pseudomonas sp. S2_H01]
MIKPDPHKSLAERITELNSPVPRGFRPPDNFILCTSMNGQKTFYGQLVWDINPLRLSAKLMSKIHFDNYFDPKKDVSLAQNDLIEEAKYILFCIMYYSASGYGGTVSAAGVLDYSNTVRLMARFCDAMKANPLVGTLSLRQVMTNPVYLGAMLKSIKDRPSQQRNILNIISRLGAMGEQNLGYRVSTNFDDFSVPPPGPRVQHPVIPTKLYVGLIDGLLADLSRFASYSSNLENLIGACADRAYGVQPRTQHGIAEDTGIQLQPDFETATRDHSLSDFFKDDFSCKNRVSFSHLVAVIQHSLKYIIHTFTGMRDQEVGRLPYDCLMKEVVEKEVYDDQGLIRDPGLIIDIISTTTKHTGYRKDASWLATTEVVQAVGVAQALCRGLSRILGIPPESMLLFTRSSPIHITDRTPRPTQLLKKNEPALFSRLIISQSDLNELLLSNPERTFSIDDGFEVGKPWPISTHQLRRSLAFYGSSSGFISLPSIAKQFKHFCKQMARYYANHFEKIKTIFGYYDPKTDEYKIPHTHFLYEFQLATPMNTALELINEVLGEMPLYGGGGAQIQRQRELIATEQLDIRDFREDTVKRVKAGDFVWRSTMLGGCMKQGDCDTYMLGQVTTCLSCDGAAISPEKLDKTIEQTRKDLLNYSKGSGEYQITESELNKLTDFHTKHVKSK